MHVHAEHPPVQALLRPVRPPQIASNRLVCARSGELLQPPQAHYDSFVGPRCAGRRVQPIPSARARVLILTLISPSTGVAAGARGGGAQEGARAVALAAPLAASARSLHPQAGMINTVDLGRYMVLYVLNYIMVLFRIILYYPNLRSYLER